MNTEKQLLITNRIINQYLFGDIAVLKGLIETKLNEIANKKDWERVANRIELLVGLQKEIRNLSLSLLNDNFNQSSLIHTITQQAEKLELNMRLLRQKPLVKVLIPQQILDSIFSILFILYKLNCQKQNLEIMIRRRLNYISISFDLSSCKKIFNDNLSVEVIKLILEITKIYQGGIQINPKRQKLYLRLEISKQINLI